MPAASHAWDHIAIFDRHGFLVVCFLHRPTKRLADMSQPSHTQPVVHLARFSAPSIPRDNQCYGYDEAGNSGTVAGSDFAARFTAGLQMLHVFFFF